MLLKHHGFSCVPGVAHASWHPAGASTFHLKQGRTCSAFPIASRLHACSRCRPSCQQTACMPPIPITDRKRAAGAGLCPHQQSQKLVQYV